MSEKKIFPRCLKDEGDHFVSAEGYWYPCCILSKDEGAYFRNDDFDVLKGKDFHLKDKFLLWVDYYLSDYDTALGSCKKKCGRECPSKIYTSGDDFIYV